MQTIVLLHNHFDAAHLEAVKAEMLTKGAPTIRVYDLGFDNLCQAIEGCHRLRACEALGITPNLEYVDADADLDSLDGLDVDAGTVEKVCELGDWENYAISEDDIEENAA